LVDIEQAIGGNDRTKHCQVLKSRNHYTNHRDKGTHTELTISSFYFNPTEAQLDYPKRMLKFTLKFATKCSYMFRFNNHDQGATVRALLKL
jgi:hypothetical protein